MPKIKTHRGAAKRFKRTGNGGFKCGQSHRRHILTKKSTKRKRQLRAPATIHPSDVRINAAARLSGMSYSRFINGLTKANVKIDRKVLADIAVRDIAAFAKIAEIAKEHQSKP